MVLLLFALPSWSSELSLVDVPDCGAFDETEVRWDLVDFAGENGAGAPEVAEKKENGFDF